ncbi:MAG: hypothetical protein HW388_1181 [Dehalococcoidia bacterium]|nr:hypothetical protein [Dehalococcoidia bacterium]
MSTLRKLVLTDNMWRVETLPFPQPPADSVDAVVEATLLTPEAQGHGLWVGHDALSPTTRYAGWGPAMDRLSINRRDLVTLPEGSSDPLAAGLLMPACAIASALEGLTITPHAAVVGEGLLADLATGILALRGFALEAAQPGADLDLVVDTGGGPGLEASGLSALRGEGTLLLLVPPWSKPVNVSFYPYIHRRSLVVIARRWHCQPQAVGQELVDSLRPVVSRVVGESRWLRPLAIGSAAVQRGVWQWMDWQGVPCTLTPQSPS